MQLLPPERRLRSAVKHGWTWLVGAARRRRPLALPRRAAVLAAIDPVALTVRVPDARVGEIFRAALAEMQKTRLTDRLIAIAIDDDPDAGHVPTRA